MADLPIKHRKAGEVIVSVGISDLATGINRTDLYAGKVSGSNHVLSNVPFFSDSIKTTLTDTNLKEIFVMDFELTQVMEGQTIIQIPIINSDRGPGAGTVSLHVSLDHMDANGMKTGIVSGSTSSITLDDVTNTRRSKRTATMFDVPLTIFRSGESLQLELQPEITGGNSFLEYGHSPMGRALSGGEVKNSLDGAAVESTLIVQAPFKIDL